MRVAKVSVTRRPPVGPMERGERAVSMKLQGEISADAAGR